MEKRKRSERMSVSDLNKVMKEMTDAIKSYTNDDSNSDSDKEDFVPKRKTRKK